MDYPSTATHVVIFDDEKVGWWDSATESFGGDDTVVANAIMHAVGGMAVRLGHIVIGANSKSPLGIAGALASYNPGRAFFEVIPDEVASHAFDDSEEERQPSAG
ncbi:hypothetical protein [Glutamicibacter ardleyensis]|uniref:hypothetical protein n=1 Tax=Glutamicibacter ardleyensis TaxID=225894 RepID=UPI003FD21503